MPSDARRDRVPSKQEAPKEKIVIIVGPGTYLFRPSSEAAPDLQL